MVMSYSLSKVPPRPSGPVADFAGIIDKTSELKINTLARKLWVETKFGLLIVTTDSLEDGSAGRFVADLCREWHVWTKENPEGAVVLCCLHPFQLVVEPGKGSREYLHPEVIETVISECGIKRTLADSFGIKLFDMAAGIAARVTGSKRITPDDFPEFSDMTGSKKLTAGGRVERIVILILFGLGVLIPLTGVICNFISERSLCRYTREPFGNPLSGEGFGGRLL